ncbi:hypothetical protein CK203_020759 [Vitis vinifera]|uniref:Uncharacterized protein n=1 Tax=Vitis vinifera TaxID=29760 RepID=A0A438II14_VITVI|nr:hypothetical protein CK203_020759 [Vitis vinifera]
MGSRDKDQTAPHQPLLSSLVIRPSDSSGGGTGGSDYEPGELRREAPHYSRSDRFGDGPGLSRSLFLFPFGYAIGSAPKPQIEAVRHNIFGVSDYNDDGV